MKHACPTMECSSYRSVGADATMLYAADNLSGNRAIYFTHFHGGIDMELALGGVAFAALFALWVIVPSAVRKNRTK